MDIWLFVRGLLIGLSIAAPVGPIGVLVIRRTLAEGRLTGLVTGLGAATADALYGAVGALGLTAISSLLVGGSLWLRLFGGVFLCYLGVRTLLAPLAASAMSTTAATRLRAYFATLLLTLANPTTILSFAAVFAGLGVSNADGGIAALTIVAGVFVGSALWWLVLSSGISLVRSRATPGTLRWINRVSGAVICVFGVAALVSIANG